VDGGSKPDKIAGSRASRSINGTAPANPAFSSLDFSKPSASSIFVDTVRCGTSSISPISRCFKPAP
jgi:hypothetical protein